MNYKKLFFALVFLSFTACRDQTKCNGLYRLTFGGPGQTNNYTKVFLQGKSAIPCLIDLIDKDNKSFVGCLNPLSSYIPPFIINNYIGINAAYLIELILSSNSLLGDSSTDWRDATNSFKIYHYCVIVKIKGNKPVLEPLHYHDMKAIKGIYLDWWEANKDKPIQELRKMRTDNNHILDGSNYQWI
jgi:hypothetical protein